MKKKWYKDKVFVITGASGGIGSEVCRTFATLGLRMYLLDLPSQALDDLVEEVKKLGAAHAESMNMNLTNPEEVKKEFSPWLLMRFISSSDRYAEHYLLMANELVNKNFSDVSSHPELQWKLLAACGSGQRTNHQWIPPAKKREKKSIHHAMKKAFPNKKEDEIRLLLKLMNDDEKIDILLDLGYNTKECTEMLSK